MSALGVNYLGIDVLVLRVVIIIHSILIAVHLVTNDDQVSLPFHMT